MTANITISDCYNGLINQIFNEEFQVKFIPLLKKHDLERKNLLEKRNLDENPSTLPHITWNETVSNYWHIKQSLQDIASVRELGLEECNFCIDGQPVSAGILDLFTILALSTKRKKAMIIYFQKCETSSESKWWENLMSDICRELKIDQALFKANFMFEAVDTIPAKNGEELSLSPHILDKEIENLFFRVM